MVARLNGVQEAAGSNPVTRTMKSPEVARFQGFFFIFAPKPVQYIYFIPEHVPELYQNRVWKRWTQWDALLRPYQLREALDGGGFDAALDVEIMFRHVYLRVTGKGLYCLHRHALRLKLAHESVAARVRRERPDTGDGLNRSGKLVAEVLGCTAYPRLCPSTDTACSMYAGASPCRGRPRVSGHRARLSRSLSRRQTPCLSPASPPAGCGRTSRQARCARLRAPAAPASAYL